jgi:hypothetical protein
VADELAGGGRNDMDVAVVAQHQERVRPVIASIARTAAMCSTTPGVKGCLAGY